MMRVSAAPAASACSRDFAPRVPQRSAPHSSARALALASPTHLRCATACAPRALSASFSSGGRFPQQQQQQQQQQQRRKQPASASPRAGLRSAPPAEPFAPACADVISPASAASAVAKAYREARVIAGAASLALVAAAAASGAAGPADGDAAKPAAEVSASEAAIPQQQQQQHESSGSWWDRWKARSAGLKEKVAKLGLAAVLAYGLFDGITYTTFFVLAFLGYEKSTGLNPAANLKALLGIVVLMWTGNNVTRPFRVAGAAAVAPFLDKALKKFQEKLNLPNQFLAFALVAGTFGAICLSVVGLLILSRIGGIEPGALLGGVCDSSQPPVIPPGAATMPSVWWTTSLRNNTKVMLFSQGAKRWIAPPTATSPSSPPPSRPSSSPVLDWSKPWAASLTASLPLNQSLTIVFTSSSSSSSASASPSSASPAFALQAPSGRFLAPSSPTPQATFAATAASIVDAAAFVAEPAPGDPSSLLIRLASPPAAYLTVSAPPASLLALHPPGSLPARPAYFRVREGMEVAAARGVNLGGWVVAEEWMEPGLFEGVPDVVDGVLVQLQAKQSGKYVSLWDAATGEIRASATSPSSSETFFLRLAPGPASSPPLSLSSPSSSPANNRLRGEWQLSQGLRATQGDAEAEKRVKEHRAGFVREEDVAYLSHQGVNTVRVPVGYWTVYGEGEGESGGTPFVGGGLAMLDQLFDWAEKHGVRVLFSMHGAHGSQNGYDHSGSQDGFGEFGRADSAYHVTATLNTIQLLVKRYAARPAFLGMGVLNEPTSNWVNAQALSSFYLRAYTAVRAASPCAYVGLSTYADTDSPFLKGLMTGDEHTNVLVDLHVYSVHAEKLRQMSLQQNLQFLTVNRSAEIRQYQEGNRLAMVGEWSLALPTDNNSDDDVKKFADTQRRVFGQAKGGWYFWSLKLNRTDNYPNWSFCSSVAAGWLKNSSTGTGVW
ncbi:unnamed protein product [Closterium sp. Yama58-4]|nr:unnamed protein product [Closterium sp. Yama58-4]